MTIREELVIIRESQVRTETNIVNINKRLNSGDTDLYRLGKAIGIIENRCHDRRHWGWLIKSLITYSILTLLGILGWALVELYKSKYNNKEKDTVMVGAKAEE